MKLCYPWIASIFVLTLTTTHADELRREHINAQAAQNTVPQAQLQMQNVAKTSGKITLEDALYFAVVQKDWKKVENLLTYYQQQPRYDPALVFFARGAKARAEGKGSLAENEFAKLYAFSPDFTIGQIEYARILYENSKYRESQQIWDKINLAIVPTDARNNLSDYGQAIASATKWHGSFSLGPHYDSNVENSSESNTCFFMYEGTCYSGRFLPKRKGVFSLSYETFAGKLTSINQRHYMITRVLAWGDQYQENRYSEHNFYLYNGYQWLGERSKYALLPFVAIDLRKGTRLYHSVGAQQEFTWLLNARTLANLTMSYEARRYRNQQNINQGDYFNSFMTLQRQLTQTLALSAGLDYLSLIRTDEKVDSYRGLGLRLGLNWQPTKYWDSNLTAIYRQRNYRAYATLFEAKRKDKEFALIYTQKFPTVKWHGVYPSMRFRYSHVKSNVDWYYSYHKMDFYLLLNRDF